MTRVSCPGPWPSCRSPMQQLAPTSLESCYEVLCNLIWPNEIPFPLYDSDLTNWTVQGFEIAKNDPFKIGFFQPKNGPCGLLAAIQALMVKELIYGAGGWKDPSSPPSEQQVATAFINTLCSILDRAQYGQNQRYNVVLQRDPSQGFSLLAVENFALFDVPRAQLAEFLAANIAQIVAPGGAILFLYSLVLTAGIASVREDMKVGTFDSTLVVGDWALCSQALVNLCVLGRAISGVDDDMMQRYQGEHHIGLLTFEEVENITFASGYTLLADSLKHPTYPIYIIHGGDHYTTLFGFDPKILSVGAPKKKVGVAGDSGKCVNDCGFHGNPATFGYCSTCYKKVSAEGAKPKPTEPDDGKCKGGCGFFGAPANHGYCSLCFKKLSPQQVQELSKKPEPAAGDVVVGADYSFKCYHYNGLPPAGPAMTTLTVSKQSKDDSVSNPNTLKGVGMVIQRRWAGDDTNGFWEYEVAQRFDKDFRPTEAHHLRPPPEKWRCCNCVLNEIYNFNPPGSQQCQTCDSPLNLCGQTSWVKYEQLSLMFRREADERYQPKIVSLLHMRWPFTAVDFGGTKGCTI